MSNKITLHNTYFDVNRLTLWADKGDFEQTPRFLLSFADGRPRFVTYAGETGSIINFPTDPVTMLVVVQAIELIANGARGKKISIPSLGMKYVNNERTNEKRIVSTLHIAKTNNGIVALSIFSEGKPKIGFAFAASNWHEFRDETETALDKELESKMYALAYAAAVKSLVLKGMWDHTYQAYENSDYKPGEIKAPGSNGNNGGKGNWNNNNNNRNNNNNSQQRAPEKQWKDNTNNGNKTFATGADIDTALTSFDADTPF